METIVVFVDDADHAARLLQPLLESEANARWVLVACAPRLTHRIGKWVSHGNRERWRQHWAERLLATLTPLFARCPADSVESLLARDPLVRVTAQLRKRLGPELRVFDARRPKLGQALEPVTAAQPSERSTRWAAPIALSSGLSALLALSD